MTAQGDLLRQIFKGYKKRDDTLFKNAAEAIIREERSKNHRLLADDLEKILLNGNGIEKRQIQALFDIPKDRERGFALLDIDEFSYTWNRLVTPTKTVTILKEIVNENLKRDILAASGIEPRKKLLFYGPPGCGKTIASKVFASELQIPLVTVRFDAIISSYLGETAANLRRVFEFIERGEWVVLFDEFDAIGKDRDDPFEHGELKRVVNTLLQLMDAFKGESVLIAATNHEALLDNAVWRRFDAVIPFNPPTEQDIVLLLRLFLKSFDFSEINMTSIVRKLKGATGSDIEHVVGDVIRRAVLDNRNKVSGSDFDLAIDALHDRLAIIRKIRDINTKVDLETKED